MRHLFTLLLLTGIILSNLSLQAQISGNQAYQERYSRSYGEDGSGYKTIIVKDSIMQVTASVLLNSKADHFVVTIGLNEEGKTVKEVNNAINRRLFNFKKNLSGIGIPADDVYIDFISQTKIYDFRGTGMEAIQYLKGFEIKKNVIVKMRANDLFEKVIELAAENEIYDIVKVDYMNTNVEKIHADMMLAAADVIKHKKEMYVKISPVELSPSPKIKLESFYSIYPNNRYKNYEAFESSEVTANYNAGLVQKLQRKNKTFYYDKIDQSKFDVVINTATPVVGIQYVLEVMMEYGIKKN